MLVLSRSVFGLIFQLNAPAFIHEGLEGKVYCVGDARDAWVRCAYVVTTLHALEISQPLLIPLRSKPALPMDWVR